MSMSCFVIAEPLLEKFINEMQIGAEATRCKSNLEELINWACLLVDILLYCFGCISSLLMF